MPGKKIWKTNRFSLMLLLLLLLLFKGFSRQLSRFDSNRTVNKWIKPCNCQEALVFSPACFNSTSHDFCHHFSFTLALCSVKTSTLSVTITQIIETYLTLIIALEIALVICDCLNNYVLTVKAISDCMTSWSKANSYKWIHKQIGISSGTYTRWLFVHCIQIELEFGNVGFWGEGKTGLVPGEKALVKARTKTNNKLNPHMTPSFWLRGCVDDKWS